jgi:ketosteroid isomerase-like protein
VHAGSAGRAGTERRLTIIRTLFIGGALALLVVSLAACGGSSTSSAIEQALQQKADFWDIDQIEKNFHEATTKKDIDLMMSLWSPNATLTVGPAQTATGREQIRQLWLEKSVAFEPTNHWISDHPAYKVRITVNGDRGTLHFECHYVDAKTGKVALATAADQDVARINGQWLITNMVAGSTALTP